LDNNYGSPTLDINYHSLRNELHCALANPALLPARQAARAAYSPSLSYGRHFGPALPSARPAAVVLLIEPRDEQWTVPLTVRAANLPDHPGQVSLPGGRLEAGESFRQAAEREFQEELGCELTAAHWVGELLPLYVYHSDFYVRSFVAISDRAYQFHPCSTEVARVVHLPLSVLVHSTQSKRREFTRGLTSWSAPAIESAGATVWGATAMILADLGVLLQQAAKGLPSVQAPTAHALC
jgi:8-oxo-dGTP pyrophosphatase MutT (NUDIX family)